MSFPRHPPAPSPPPGYEYPPNYSGAVVDLSSSPDTPLGTLRAASPSGLSDLEEDAFGHRITLPADLQSFSFDPSRSFDPHRHSFDSLSSLSVPNANTPFGTQYGGYNFPDISRLPLSLQANDPDVTEAAPRLNVFPVDPNSSSTRRRRAPAVTPMPPRAPAVAPTPPAPPAPPPVQLPSPDEADDTEVLEFEINLHIYPPPPKVKPRKRVPKPEPKQFGPIQANTGMDEAELFGVLAHAINTEHSFLSIASAQWRWMKPANSVFRPLNSDAGVKSLMKKIRDPPKNTEAEIIIKMDEPAKKPSTQQTPWAPSTGSTSRPSAFDSAYDAAFGVDEANSDDDGAKTKAPFDDGLEDEIERLEAKYPAGLCSLHPDVACFHNRLNDVHYELNRNRKIIWAAAIKGGKATLITPPVGSNYFKATDAIRKKKTAEVNTNSGPPMQLPSTPSAPPFPFYQNPYAFPTPPGYPTPAMGYPSPFTPYGPPPFYGQMTPWQETPSRRRRDRSWELSSPPRQSSSKRVRSERAPDPLSSPGVSGGSLDDFFDKYPLLPIEAKTFLVKLGFEIGDDISIINEVQWSAADIPIFTSTRIVKMYNKYKATLR